MNDFLMTTAELADYLKTPKRTLEYWRQAGDGPRYVRLTKRCVRYAWRDVADWIESRTFAHSAEADAA